MAYIPPGEFTMGCSKGDAACRDDEKPAVKTKIDRGFCMDIYEVKQADYRRFIGENPSAAHLCGSDCPVESVTWDDAVHYCRNMSKRLPTEAEWEYAARGKTNNRYYWGDKLDDKYAWHNGNSGLMPRPIGRKKPNAFGLYDMLGNVWEWTQDCYDEEWYSKRQTAGDLLLNRTPGCTPHVARGGAWTSYTLSVSERKADSYNDADQGFRCAKDARE